MKLLPELTNSGGELRIIATILEQSVIEKILTQLGLQAHHRHAGLVNGFEVPA